MLPAVARWGATFCSFWGIGEGGTAFPRESWSRGGGPCGPRYAGAPREHGLAMLGAPGDFRFTTKVTKGVPGALPLDPVGGALSSPPTAQAPFPPERVSGTDSAGFATLRLHRNWLSLLPKLHRGNTGCFQTVARERGIDGNRGVGTEEVRFL